MKYSALGSLLCCLLTLGGCRNDYVDTVGLQGGWNPNTGDTTVGINVSLKEERQRQKDIARAAVPSAKAAKREFERQLKSLDKRSPCYVVEKNSLEFQIKECNKTIDAGKSSLRTRFAKTFGICPLCPPKPQPVFDPPVQQPSTEVPSFPQIIVVNPPTTGVEPPTESVVKIGSIIPSDPLHASDLAIINGLIANPKDTPNQRHRILLAGDNYPGTNSALDYCIFDTSCRHALGLVKSFKIDPSSFRVLRNSEYSKANLVKFTDWVFDDVQPGDIRAIFLSSHGTKDIGPSGAVEGLIVTHDMIATGVWSPETEIRIDYWKMKCRSVSQGCNVTLVFDMCHAGADIRALLGSIKKSRSIEGPQVVQERVDTAKTRTVMRDVNVYNIQFIPMCLDSELSEEGPNTGGAGSWGLWNAIDDLGIDAPTTTLVRSTNGYLKSNVFSQHVTVLGRNSKMPLFKAAPVPAPNPAQIIAPVPAP